MSKGISFDDAVMHVKKHSFVFNFLKLWLLYILIPFVARRRHCTIMPFLAKNFESSLGFFGLYECTDSLYFSPQDVYIYTKYSLKSQTAGKQDKVNRYYWSTTLCEWFQTGTYYRWLALMIKALIRGHKSGYWSKSTVVTSTYGWDLVCQEQQ